MSLYEPVMEEIGVLPVEAGAECPGCRRGALIQGGTPFDRYLSCTSDSCSWSVQVFMNFKLLGLGHRDAPRQCGAGHVGAWAITARVGKRTDLICAYRLDGVNCPERVSIGQGRQGFTDKTKPKRKPNASKAILLAALSRTENAPMTKTELVHATGMSRSAVEMVVRGCLKARVPWLQKMAEKKARPAGGYSDAYRMTRRGHLFITWASERGLMRVPDEEER